MQIIKGVDQTVSCLHYLNFNQIFYENKEDVYIIETSLLRRLISFLY